MELERLLRRTLAIQAIPAPTFEEAARADYLQAEFEHAGLLDVERDEIGNLYVQLKGDLRPPVIVSAHLDTVFPSDTQLQVQHVGDRLIGPGIGDNALSLATLVELAIDYLENPPEGDVWLVANVCEEGLGNLHGMRQVVDRFGDQAMAFIVLEGFALGHIYHRALPVRRYRISTSTEGGHSWNHAGRPSAIHTLLELGAKITQLHLAESPRTTLNVGKIEGGTSINTIAAQASLEIDLRSEEESMLSQLEKKITAFTKSYPVGDVDIKISLIGERPGGGIKKDHPLVQAAIRAVEASGESTIYLKCGSTDASVPLSKGLPAICIGLTHGGDAHSMKEYIEIEPISRGYQALISLIKDGLLLGSDS